jgi:ATP-dependent Lon protease
MSELDHIDHVAASALEGYLVRKDLVRAFSRQFPVPTYVVEFLLGRYCASTDQKEIDEGLEIVQRQLESRTVKAGEEELFKSRARENGEVKLIDLITARLDAKTDSYIAILPSLQLIDARISDEIVRKHERMLTGGFYAEITLSYDAAIAEENKGRPFGVESLREIQLSKYDILDILAKARQGFTTEEWKTFLLRSVGIEPATLSERA